MLPQSVRDHLLRKVLLSSLKETLLALEAHLKDDAARENMPVEQVCQCATEEVVRARRAIAMAEES
jgi:hypothetical protein